HEDDVGTMAGQRRQPIALDGVTKSDPRRTRGQRRVDDVVAFQIEQPMWIVWMLETRTNEHFWRFFEYVDRAVAVMNVEIEDCHTFDTWLLQCEVRAERDVVEKTEP